MAWIQICTEPCGEPGSACNPGHGKAGHLAYFRAFHLIARKQREEIGPFYCPLALLPPPSHLPALEQWLHPAVSAQDGDAICSHKPACSGVITPCQIVEVLPVLVFLAAGELLIVFAFNHLAFV